MLLAQVLAHGVPLPGNMGAEWLGSGAGRSHGTAASSGNVQRACAGCVLLVGWLVGFEIHLCVLLLNKTLSEWNLLT